MKGGMSSRGGRRPRADRVPRRPSKVSKEYNKVSLEKGPVD